MLFLFTLFSVVFGAKQSHFYTKQVSKLGNDPASSWMAYVGYLGSGRITKLSAEWAVPSSPEVSFGSNAPGWWFGIEDSANSLLIQPILAYGDGDSDYTIFNGYFNWHNMGWWQSSSTPVQPGDVVKASVAYVESTNSYNMLISKEDGSGAIKSNIPCQYNATFVNAYFVFEHQPELCAAFPKNGQCIFYNVELEVEGKRVVSPHWVDKLKAPACQSKAKVLNETSFLFTWKP